MKDYDLDIQYYSGKANVVADALSRKSQINLAPIITQESRLLEEMRLMGLHIGASLEFARALTTKMLNIELSSESSKVITVMLAAVNVQPRLHDQLRNAQQQDLKCQKFREGVESGRDSPFQVDNEGILRFGDRICVPDDLELRFLILSEAHESKCIKI
jgi:hypothetical protein